MILSCEADSKLPCIPQLTRLPPIEGGANCSSKRESCSISTHLSLPMCAERTPSSIISPYRCLILPYTIDFTILPCTITCTMYDVDSIWNNSWHSYPLGFWNPPVQNFLYAGLCCIPKSPPGTPQFEPFAELKHCNFLAPFWVFFQGPFISFMLLPTHVFLDLFFQILSSINF